ncbi:MAG: NAD(P)H-quinone oxidoreductase subunit D4, partial [Cyanobium sp.]
MTLLAALAIPLMGSDCRRLQLLGAGSALVQLLLGLICWRQPPADLQLAWLPRLGLSLDLGLDGLSL